MIWHGLLTAATLLSAPAGAQIAAAASAPADRWTVIHAGTLLASANERPRRDVSIIVRNGRIESIRPGLVKSVSDVPLANVTFIDLADKFVMPGMIDAHVHIALRPGVGIYRAARDKLLGGATTVRDGASRPELIFPLRDAVNAGFVVGPRILASGAPISATGGHGDLFRNGDFLASLAPPPFSWGICDGPDECRKITRRQVQLGADQIKIMATAGVLDDSDTGVDQQLDDAELNAIVTAAHLMKRPVMAHAIGATGIKAAVRAGVDTIEHGLDLDDEGAEMMRRQGTFLVPTLFAPYEVLRRIRSPRPGDAPLSESSRRKMLAQPEARPGGLGRQIRIAVRHGVKLGAGTDIGGTIGDELVLMVEQGGLTPQQALRAATITNAEMLGISGDAGTIAAGKSADIVALDGDPLQDIHNVTKVSFVMAQGREAKGPGFALP